MVGGPPQQEDFAAGVQQDGTGCGSRGGGGSWLVEATGKMDVEEDAEEEEAGEEDEFEDEQQDEAPAGEGVSREEVEGPGVESVRERFTTVQQLHLPPRRQLHGLSSWETRRFDGAAGASPSGGETERSKASARPLGRTAAAAGASSSLPSQLHLPCTDRDLRMSRQCEHCDVGRPFFLISTRERVVWVHLVDRCPLMQAWQAYLIPSISTIFLRDSESYDG